ncbi:MAG: HlyD family efflux transporter periplasmic adaptor subunit, partial [Planctomycetaceae bacterium]|nr:HlyD family efflux transporter periplasmic adaptor subunit [Planctomycetaceae bacterium]
ARLEAERATLQIEQSESELIASGLERDERKAQLDAYRIEAPFAGVVTRVLRRPGEAVREGDPILELVSTRRLRVEGYVDVRVAAGIRRGNRVEVALPREELSVTSIPGAEQDENSSPKESPERFAGRIVFVDLSVEPNTQTVRIQAEVTDHGDRLRAGLTAGMLVYPEPAEADTTGTGQTGPRQIDP